MSKKSSFGRSTWLSAIALASGLAMSGSASAVIVTDWSYSILSNFTSFQPDDVVSFNFNSEGPNTGLRWGTGSSGSSSLTIDTNSSGSVLTYIGGGTVPIFFAEDGDIITHNNQPINGSSLTSAVIQSTLSLTPVLPALPGVPTISPLNINIAFAETPNAIPCASSSLIPCNDIFVLTGGLLNSTFNFDGQDYFVNVFPIAGSVLSLLSPGECDAAGATSGCIGFSTVEGQSNAVQFAFTVSTERLTTVPEPATLALLGVGLIGLGATRRRKNAV